MTSPMTPWELVRWLRSKRPDNRHREEGFALVDVRELAHDAIPGSMSRAAGDLREGCVEALAARFAPEKVIVVYGTDENDRRTRRIADALAERGFRRIRLLTGGPRDWRRADARLRRASAVEGSAASRRKELIPVRGRR